MPQDFAPVLTATDTAAVAVVLCDYAQAHIDGRQGQLQVVIKRHTRILIRKPSGFDYASGIVDLWKDEKGDHASLRGLRGATYNLVGGQIHRDTLASEAVFTLLETPRWRSQRFTLPQVRVGSIVEFTYTLVSDDLQRLPVWVFQRRIPVRWSEFRLEVPTFLNYHMVLRSAHPPAVNEHRGGLTMQALTAQTVEAYNLPIRPTDLQRGVGATFSRWVLRDVPVLPDWSFLPTVRDYQAQLEIELKSMALPGYPERNYTTTWERIDERLRADEQVGQRLHGGGFLRDEMVQLRRQHPEAAARAAAVYAWVQQHMKYDDQEVFWAERPLRQAWAAHRGNAAEINLLLVLALREAGLPADPVVLSTRAHGRVLEDYPSQDRFNYLAAVLLRPDSSSLFLDATDPLVPVGLLPERLHGVRGRVLPAKGPGRWVTLEPGQGYVHRATYSLQLTPAGDLQGQIHLEEGGYAGLRERHALRTSSERAYLGRRFAGYDTWTLTNFRLNSHAESTKPLTLDVAATRVHPGGPLTALLLELPAQLPSLLQEVLHASAAPGADLGAPQEWLSQVILTLPPGFAVASAPAPLALALPKGAGRYSFTVTHLTPTQVVFTNRLQLQQAAYGAADLAALRELLRLAAAKSAERLVVERVAPGLNSAVSER
ncbi:DUF3857 domain-containing protein [Hymenobacter terrenus]|uniref:DUF3857 domain-containing protein n=1 Tax=Hymenobacter terrenus TaxID=1629124 RepID=UPI000AA5D325|nr:DUF3857 domain-containing protein [Hymenobacter terrenus]